MKESNKKSGLATSGLVLGIVGICLSFIPILNNASFFLGVLAVIFGIICLAKKTGKNKAIASLILGILSIIITLSLQSAWSSALNEVGKELEDTGKDLTGENTETILQKDVDIKLGSFETSTDEYGLTETKLIVNVTNKSDINQSYNIQIEAVDASGTRIEDDSVYVNSLGAGQSQEFKAFEFVSSEKVESLKSATFKIVEISKF